MTYFKKYNTFKLEYDTTAWLKDLLEEMFITKKRLPLERRCTEVEPIVALLDEAYIKRVESIRFMEEYVAQERLLVRWRVRKGQRNPLRDDVKIYDRLKRYELNGFRSSKFTAKEKAKKRVEEE